MTTATTDIPTTAPLSATPVAPSLRERLVGAYELTKPRMNFLILVTTAVGFYLAAGPGGLWQRAWLFAATLVGTALTAAGASVLNQFVERDADALMPRTRRRPLPAGLLSPAFALASGVALGLVGTAWLALLVNPLTAALGAFTLLSYVLVYTPMKRRTPWCTLVGAVPGAIPPMMGFTAVEGTISPGAWALFAILFVWQMPHFYGLAILYKDDYARGGYAMLPSRPNGTLRTARQSVGFLALLLPASLLPTLAGVAGYWYAAAAVLLWGWFFAAGVQCWRSLGKADARKLFFASILYLPLLLGVMMLDRQ